MIDPDDRDGQTCTKCGIGYYYETSIHDDWDGVLHCNNKKCNHEVKRYKSKDNPPPKPEKVKLSPAAQAVLDAAFSAYWSAEQEAPNDEGMIAAAALRAAADQAHPKAHIEDINYVHQNYVDGWKDALDVILAIADELEE